MNKGGEGGGGRAWKRERRGLRGRRGCRYKFRVGWLERHDVSNTSVPRVRSSPSLSLSLYLPICFHLFLSISLAVSLPRNFSPCICSSPCYSLSASTLLVRLILSRSFSSILSLSLSCPLGRSRAHTHVRANRRTLAVPNPNRPDALCSRLQI